MKRFISLFLISCIFFGVFSQTFALPKAEPGTIVSYLQSRPAARYVSHSELFMTMVDSFGERMEIPRSYRHIDLQGSLDIATRDTRLYRAYQKAVYMDLIKIKDIPLRLSGGATHAKLIDLTERFFGEEVNGVMLVEGEKLERNNKKLRYDDLRSYVDIILTPETTDWAITKADGFDLLNDAYLKITTEHIDREKFVERDLMYGAIGGLAQATGDKYTTFFPPTESAGFNDSLNGEFEGIGAFVEMEKPGELMVISPIRNSPAEK